MLVWKGWGILVAVVAMAGLIVAESIADALFGRGTYSGHVARWAPLGLLAAAAILWPLGRRLNGGEGRLLVDPRSGETVVLRRTHSLFFVRVEHWALVLGALSFVLLIYSFIGP